MYAAEFRGDIKEGTAERWEKHTKGKKLPEKVKKSKKGESVSRSSGFRKRRKTGRY